MFSGFISSLHHPTALKTARAFLLKVALMLLLADVSLAQGRFKTNGNNSAALFQNKLELGVAGGFSLNSFTKEQPQTGLNTGFTAGASVNYKVYQPLSVQLEVNFLQQGGQMVRFKDDTRIGLPETFETKNVKNSSYILNSIEIPLLANYTFNIKPAWKPAIYIGGSYAYTFNVTENYQKTGDLLPGEDIIATVSGSQNVTGAFNRGRINFIAGANVKLPLTSKLMLLLDFRYLTGLTTARENYSYMEKEGFGSAVRTNSFVSKIGLVLPVANNKTFIKHRKLKYKKT